MIIYYCSINVKECNNKGRMGKGTWSEKERKDRSVDSGNKEFLTNILSGRNS